MFRASVMRGFDGGAQFSMGNGVTATATDAKEE